MTVPAVLLLVRFRSKLSLEEVMTVANERADDFRALTGLQQKYYLQDPATGEYGGLYLWDSIEALDSYRKSELRATIAEAYQVEGEPRVEAYGVQMALREEGA